MSKGSPQIDESLTRKMAELSRLELTDVEVKTYTSQLAQILGYVEQLQEVDVSQVEPLTFPIELQTAWREDRVVESVLDSEGKPKVLSSGPEVLYDGYKVPPIL